MTGRQKIQPEDGRHRSGSATNLPPQPPPPSGPLSLVAEVRASTTAMTLTAADSAAVALALTYAAHIDAATANGSGEELTKALFLGPHLLRVLESLGGTPAGRKASKTAARQPAGSTLTALRARSQVSSAG